MVHQDELFFDFYYKLNYDNKEQMQLLYTNAKSVYSQHLALALLYDTPYLNHSKYKHELVKGIHEYFTNESNAIRLF